MLATLLLAWYDQHKRTLPFRGTKDPYRIWVSEIMLQQTRTETVGAYYERFLALFPDVFALAAADEQEVLKAWEGLGYYSRARNLHKAAKKIVAEYNGLFPADLEMLRGLPGVGDYTAAAIGSIAFDLPAPAMDGNLTRVFARVHGVRRDVGAPSVKRELLALAQGDMPESRCGDFNQALMDLGATICTPGTPDCERCPLRPLCNACAQEDADTLPMKAAAKPPQEVPVGVAVVTCGGKALLMERKETLLKGLWVFPLTEGENDPGAMEKRLKALGVKAVLRGTLGEAKHVFTHRIWQMKIYHYAALPCTPREGQWVTLAQMNALPLPTAIRVSKEKAAALLAPQILPMPPALLEKASAAYGESWRASHAHHCSLDFVAAHTSQHMEMILRGHMDAGKEVYALCCVQEPVGVLVLDAEKNELVSLYIHPAYQGCGLGKAAVAFAVERLDVKRDMRVTVVEDNERARGLYQSQGFSCIGAARMLNKEKNVQELELIRKGTEK